MALTIDFSTEAFIAVDTWVRSVLVVCLLMLVEVLFTGKLSSTVAALHATMKSTVVLYLIKDDSTNFCLELSFNNHPHFNILINSSQLLVLQDDSSKLDHSIVEWGLL